MGTAPSDYDRLRPGQIDDRGGHPRQFTAVELRRAALTKLARNVLEPPRIVAARQVGARGRDDPDLIKDGTSLAFECRNPHTDRFRPVAGEPWKRPAGLGRISV